MFKQLLSILIMMACASCGGDADKRLTPPTQLLRQVSASPPVNAYFPVLQQLYVAYFGRPADPAGMQWQANNLLLSNAPVDLPQLIAAYNNDATVRSMIDVFATSEESNALYSGDNDRFVTAIYRSLFNRDPDPAGKAWWINALVTGTVSRTQAAMSIMASAQGSDIDRVQVKASAASSFTTGLNNDERLAAYSGMAANEVVRNMLSTAVPGQDTAALNQSIADAITAILNLRGAGFKYDIAADVPTDQVALIKAGMVIAQDFHDNQLGGGLPAQLRKGITVKLVATGRGNEEPGGGGSCCTGLALGPGGESMLRPFLDIKHPDWNLAADAPMLRLWTIQTDHQKVIVHELTHDWQSNLGCMDIHVQPLGFWLNEGIAEFVANEAMFAHGAMKRADVRQFLLEAAYSTGELGAPLRTFGGTTASLWPGHVGYIAVDYLVKNAPQGMRAVRTICEQVAAGANVQSAFRTAFGIDMETFYSQFEAMRPQLIVEARHGG